MAQRSTHSQKRSPRTALLSVVSLAVLLVAASLLTACSSAPSTTQPTAPAATTQSAATEATAPASTTEAAPATADPNAKLKIKDIKVGKGVAAKSGDTVSVNYTGWLMNGTKFDSSLDRKQVFTFPLGGGQVIPGWDQGVVGMKVGGIRQLIIPPALGYGDQGAGGVIPPGATLRFKVWLVSIK